MLTQVNVGDKIQDQKIEKNTIEKSKGEAKIPKNIEAKAPEKIDKLVHEKIEAKSSEKNPTQKFRPKKGKENVAPQGKNRKKKQNLDKLSTQKKIVGKNKKLEDSIMEDLETKQITKFVCRKSEENFVKPKLPETPVVPVTTEKTRILSKPEVPKNKPDMALEWNNFNIKFRVIDPDFEGGNDEFELYPNFSDTYHSSDICT